jgi:hypothetical protein
MLCGGITCGQVGVAGSKGVAWWGSCGNGAGEKNIKLGFERGTDVISYFDFNHLRICARINISYIFV